MGLLTRKLLNNKIVGEMIAPQSDAILNRYLICDALSGFKAQIECTNASKDIRTLKRCISNLGIGQDEPMWENFTYRVDCKTSEAAYKFLLPIACALGKKCIYELDGNLMFSDMDPFYKILRTHGIKSEKIREDQIKVTGQLTGGTYIFPGDTDGQTLSGLLMALPLIKNKSTVMVENIPQSEPYVEMTVDIMKKSGIHIDVLKDQNGVSYVYKIPGEQKYDLASKINVEGDWALASYFFAGAAICGTSVTCTNLNLDTLQGDARFLNILRLFGAKVSWTEHQKIDAYEDNAGIFWSDVTVEGGHLNAVNIDATDIPQLLGPVMLLASCAEGVTIIKNASSLKLGKQRVENMIKAMADIGCRITELDDGILIEGSCGRPLTGGRVKSCNDYNIAMMTAIASCICDEPVVIEQADAVDRAYPDFFDVLDSMKKVPPLKCFGVPSSGHDSLDDNALDAPQSAPGSLRDNI